MLCRQARSQDLIVLGKVILERLDALTVVNPHLIGSVETGTFPVTSEASRLPCDVHVLSQIEYCARNFNFNCNSTIFVKTKDSSNSKWVSLYLNICSSLPFVTVAIIALINWSITQTLNTVECHHWTMELVLWLKYSPFFSPVNTPVGLYTWRTEGEGEGGNIISKLCRSQRRLCGGKRGRPALAVAGN